MGEDNYDDDDDDSNTDVNAKGVSTKAETAPCLRVLRPHRPQRAGEVPQGGESKFFF